MNSNFELWYSLHNIFHYKFINTSADANESYLNIRKVTFYQTVCDSTGSNLMWSTRNNGNVIFSHSITTGTLFTHIPSLTLAVAFIYTNAKVWNIPAFSTKLQILVELFRIFSNILQGTRTYLEHSGMFHNILQRIFSNILRHTRITQNILE